MDPPGHILKKKLKRKNYIEEGGKKRNKGSNDDGRSGSGETVEPIFISKGKGCRKGRTYSGMLTGVPSDTLLSNHRSAVFATKQQVEVNRD